MSTRTARFSAIPGRYAGDDRGRRDDPARGVLLGTAWWATGAFDGVLGYLVLLHAVAVTLLASFRTGVKIAACLAPHPGERPSIVAMTRA